MKKFLLLILLLNFAAASAQLCFQRLDSASTWGSPVATLSGDFNGDGKMDLVSAGQYSNYLYTLLNTGTGSFTLDSSYISTQGAVSMVSGDFNEDGIPDIATTNQPNSISVFLGNGAGTFSSAIAYTGNLISLHGITTADFNNDGHSDLAVANNSGMPGQLLLLFGTGAGNFISPTFLTLNFSSVDAMTSGDLNKDGNADLVMNASVLLGTGTGNFGASTNYYTGMGPFSPTLSDINNDGNADLIVGNHTSGNISVLLGSDSGSFAPAVNFSAGNNPNSVTVADFNGDGFKDIASGSDSTSILINDGSGNFNAISIFQTSNVNSVCSGDFNSDGKVDLGVSNYWSNKTWILSNCTQSCIPTVTDSLSKDTAPFTWNVYPNYSLDVVSARWYWGDGLSSVGLYPSHTYANPGWYNICVTAYSFCGDSSIYCHTDSIYKSAANNSMVNINVISGVSGTNSTLSTPKPVSIYPNPANDKVFIDANTYEMLDADLYDSNGEHVLSKKVKDKSTLNIIDLNIGIYILTIKTARDFVKCKLVVLR